jgi:hypothetical protein
MWKGSIPWDLCDARNDEARDFTLILETSDGCFLNLGPKRLREKLCFASAVRRGVLFLGDHADAGPTSSDGSKGAVADWWVIRICCTQMLVCDSLGSKEVLMTTSTTNLSEHDIPELAIERCDWLFRERATPVSQSWWPIAESCAKSSRTALIGRFADCHRMNRRTSARWFLCNDGGESQSADLCMPGYQEHVALTRYFPARKQRVFRIPAAAASR